MIERRAPRWLEHACARRFGARAGRRAVARRGGGVAPWDPSQLTGIAHWYRGDDVITASDDTVLVTMADREGEDDITQATVANRPAYSAEIATLGGQPGGVYTAASSQYVRGALSAAIAQPCTIVLAWSHTTLAVDQYAIAGGSLGDRWFIRANSSTLEMHAGTGTAEASITLATDAAYAGIFVLNGTSSKARINGNEVYAGTTNIGANAVEDVTLGRETSADYLDGAIAEAIIVAGDVIANATELAQLEAYLSGRYL